MRIIILGATGMLGSYCHRWFGDRVVKVVNRNELDASNCTVEQLINVLEPNCYVINCIGVIPQRSDSIKNMIMVNALFPRLVHIACKQINSTLIHISTDCVFSGKDGPYSEESFHDSTNMYGVTKSIGENNEYCTIRTSIIGVDSNKCSLLSWILTSENKQIFGYIDHHWNGVTCLQLAKVIEKCIEEGLWKGVRHVFTESVTKYELISMIKEIYGIKLNLVKYPTEIINRTLTTIHKPIEVPTIYEQIVEMRSFDAN